MLASDGIYRLHGTMFGLSGHERSVIHAGGVCQVQEYMLRSDEIGNWAGDIAKAKMPDQFLVDYAGSMIWWKRSSGHRRLRQQSQRSSL
jgi:hypothetical protein